MIEIIEPDWPAPTRVRACITTRRGGVSEKPYDGCNLALHVGDADDSVRTNRAELRRQLELAAEPGWIRQSHGTRAVLLEDDADRDADAAVSRRPGFVPVVMVADCLPILLCNRDGSEVAAVHAGWRGLQGGVIGAALDAMQSPAGELIAWIGPGISQPNFEVGDEVYRAFGAAIDGAAAYFKVSGRAGHWLCDLGGLAERVLTRRGVGRIFRDRHCTFRDRELFYSYRRDGATGRMAALIWIN